MLVAGTDSMRSKRDSYMKVARLVIGRWNIKVVHLSNGSVLAEAQMTEPEVIMQAERLKYAARVLKSGPDVLVAMIQTGALNTGASWL